MEFSSFWHVELHAVEQAAQQCKQKISLLGQGDCQMFSLRSKMMRGQVCLNHPVPSHASTIVYRYVPGDIPIKEALPMPVRRTSRITNPNSQNYL